MIHVEQGQKLLFSLTNTRKVKIYGFTNEFLWFSFAKKGYGKAINAGKTEGDNEEREN